LFEKGVGANSVLLLGKQFIKTKRRMKAVGQDIKKLVRALIKELRTI
jgi:hypothetical protein